MSYKKVLKIIVIFTGYYLLIITGIKEEYCISEIFQPRCTGQDEILVIQKAHFGRKQIGRCLQNEKGLENVNTNDERFVGCYSNVWSIIGPKCSGKKSCEVRVVELPPPDPCFNFLRAYLEITYKCIKTIQSNRQCSINLADSETQHLSLTPSTIPSYDCGKPGHPWRVETSTGQRIQATLVDFSNSESEIQKESSQDTKYRVCSVKLGYVYDRIGKGNTSICGSNQKNQRLLFSYESKSNFIEIGNLRNLAVKADEPEDFYVLRLEATGCSDLIPPADAWLKRTENEAIIGCYSTRLRWQLKCQGHRWIGVIGNCSYGAHDFNDIKQPQPAVMKQNTSEQTVVIIAIGMCGLVLSVLIGCVGIICIKKYHTLSKTRAMQLKISNNNCQYNNGGPLQSQMNKLDYDETLKHFNDNEFINEMTMTKESQQYFELDQSLVNKDLLAV